MNNSKMNKTLFAVAVTSIVSSASIFASDDVKNESTGLYISIGKIDQTADEYIPEPVGFELTFGGDINDYLGVSLSFAKADETYNTVLTETKTFGINFDLGKKFDVNEDFQIKPYGLVGIKETEFTLSNSYAEASDSSAYMGFGLGVRATFKQALVIGFEYVSNSASDDYFPDYDQTKWFVGYQF